MKKRFLESINFNEDSVKDKEKILSLYKRVTSGGMGSEELSTNLTKLKKMMIKFLTKLIKEYGKMKKTKIWQQDLDKLKKAGIGDMKSLGRDFVTKYNSGEFESYSYL